MSLNLKPFFVGQAVRLVNPFYWNSQLYAQLLLSVSFGSLLLKEISKETSLMLLT